MSGDGEARILNVEIRNKPVIMYIYTSINVGTLSVNPITVPVLVFVLNMLLSFLQRILNVL